MNINSLLIALSLIWTYQQLLAGGREVGNGGNVVQNSTTAQVRFLDLVKVPTSVILEHDLHPGFAVLEKLFLKETALSNVTIFPRRSLDNEKSRSLKNEILYSLSELTFYLVPGPLPTIDDKGMVIFYHPKGNKKILQLAIQNKWSKKVIIDRDLFATLTPFDVASFFVHEALIRTQLRNRLYSELSSTEKIGNFVNVLFDQSRPSPMREKTVARYLRDAEFLADQSYFPNYEQFHIPYKSYPNQSHPEQTCFKEPIILYEAEHGAHLLSTKNPNGCYVFAGEAVEGGRMWKIEFKAQSGEEHYVIRHYLVEGMRYRKDELTFEGGPSGKGFYLSEESQYKANDNFSFILLRPAKQ